MKIQDFDKLEELIKKVKADKSFNGKAEVFINCNDELAITWNNDFGYCGYFLDLETGKISYSD